MDQNTSCSQALGALTVPGRGGSASREQVRQTGRLLVLLWRDAAGLLAKAADRRRTRIEQRKAREQFRSIDGHLLRDLGLTRSDALAVTACEKDAQD